MKLNGMQKMLIFNQQFHVLKYVKENSLWFFSWKWVAHFICPLVIMHKSAHLYSHRQHIFQSVKTLIAKESTAEMVHGDWKLKHLNWLNAFSVKLRSKCQFVWFICSQNEINSVSAQSENKKQMFHDSKHCAFFTVCIYALQCTEMWCWLSS